MPCSKLYIKVYMEQGIQEVLNRTTELESFWRLVSCYLRHLQHM